MPAATSLCHAPLISLCLGALYGGTVTVLTDMIFSLTYETDPIRSTFFAPSRFWLSTGIGSILYLGFFPAFKWSFVQDAYRLPHSKWKMSLHTLYFLAVLYPLMIHLATETILAQKNGFIFLRIAYACPAATFLTFFAEGMQAFSELRYQYLFEIAFEDGFRDRRAAVPRH